MSPEVLPLSVVVPVRHERPDPDLGARLGALAEHVAEVIVVDGSDPAVADAHAREWPSAVRHLRLADEDRTPMGKVGGVLAGARAAGHDILVVADDDVVWQRHQLERAHAVMAGTELAALRPQNRYTEMTLVARWDTGRTLIQRALGGDWPGTVVVRRSALLPEGYRGDVLFENLELERELRRRGGTVAVDLRLVVDRVPPTATHFWGQRVRQAYDEMARPAHLAAELALLPIAVVGGRRAVVALAVGAVALAEVGRRRNDGRASFPPTAALWAPLWVGERAVTSWLAVGARLRGGVRYRDGRLRHAAGPPPRRITRRGDPDVVSDPAPRRAERTHEEVR
ncbi:MAG TPA: glycosyltransferase [Iamia sp.]|nr:glycosyltransferase [Iamia sp.]